MKESDLSIKILTCISKNPEIRPKELYRKLDSYQQIMADRLAALRELWLVERKGFKYSITPLGKIVLEKLFD